MAAEIVISPHKPEDHIYGPGDAVTGTVIFTPAFNCKLQEMKVSLRGECYTSSLGSSARVSNTVPLFGTVCDLLKEVYTFEGCTYEAHFAFKFPSETTLTHEAGPLALSPLFSQGPQHLPDSFALSTRNTVQMVRYYIHVELYGRTRAATEQTVLFRQPFSALNEDWDALEDRREPSPSGMNDSKAMHRRVTYTIKKGQGTQGPPLALHALPMMSAHYRSLSERYGDAKFCHSRAKMEWLFKPWKTSKITFMPSIYLPQRIAVNQEIPLLLAMDTVRNQQWKELPRHPFILCGFSVAITAHTRTIMQHRPTKHLWGRCMELSYQVLDVNGLYHEISIDDQALPLVEKFSVLPGAIPSFATYTINRSYSVDIYLRFNYDGDELQWNASLSLEIFSDDTLDAVRGAHTDPLLLANPRHLPEYFWNSRIEAGAAESTGRANISSSADPMDSIALDWEQWQTGHGRLPRSSYGCAKAELAKGLGRVRTKTNKGHGGSISIVQGVCGRPSRRYLKHIEPVIPPLGGFAPQWLGVDGMDGGNGHECRHAGRRDVFMHIDECGIMAGDCHSCRQP